MAQTATTLNEALKRVFTEGYVLPVKSDWQRAIEWLEQREAARAEWPWPER